MNNIESYYNQTVQTINQLAITVQENVYYSATAVAIANLALVIIVSKVTDKVNEHLQSRKFIPVIIGSLTIIGSNLLLHSYIITPLGIEAKILMTAASVVMYLLMQRSVFKKTQTSPIPQPPSPLPPPPLPPVPEIDPAAPLPPPIAPPLTIHQEQPLSSPPIETPVVQESLSPLRRVLAELKTKRPETPDYRETRALRSASNVQIPIRINPETIERMSLNELIALRDLQLSPHKLSQVEIRIRRFNISDEEDENYQEAEIDWDTN